MTAYGYARVSTFDQDLALQRADLATTIQSGGLQGMAKKLAQLDAVK